VSNASLLLCGHTEYFMIQGRELAPLLLEFVTTTELWASRSRQSDPALLAAAELCFEVIGLDPVNNPRADCLNIEKKQSSKSISSRALETQGSSVPLNSLLLGLQKQCMGLLRCVFQQNVDLRVPMLSDYFRIFAQVRCLIV
jgi:hypothetical protein